MGEGVSFRADTIKPVLGDIYMCPTCLLASSGASILLQGAAKFYY